MHHDARRREEVYECVSRSTREDLKLSMSMRGKPMRLIIILNDEERPRSMPFLDSLNRECCYCLSEK